MANSALPIPETEQRQADLLYRLLRKGAAARVGARGEERPLPRAARAPLLEVLRHVRSGRPVAVVPQAEQLTTQRAADLLGVSRPFLIRLLEQGAIPFIKVGAHRRVYLRDLLAYQQRRDAQRHAALNRLAREAYTAGLYDRSAFPEAGPDE